MIDCIGSIPVSQARGFGYSEINTTSWPYGVMVSSSLLPAVSSEDKFLENFVPLWNIYQGWLRSLTVASFLGLGPESRLARVPSWAYLLPWSERSPAEMVKWLPPRIRRNRAANGNQMPRWLNNRKIMELDSLSSAKSHGHQFFQLCQSIVEEGLWSHCNNDDPFKVWLLEDGNDWRWITYSGNHRIAAVAALGVSEVHAESQGKVLRSQVETWANVANGWFTQQEALTVFDNLFQGKMLEVTENLLEDFHLQR